MSFADVNGTRLYYDEAGAGPPVVFLHAGLLDARMWDGQVEALARRHRVIRYDARGYGRSAPQTGPFSYADDLRALLDHLGVARAAVVGCSMGGATAIDFTLEHPERVSALVPVCAAVGGFSFRAYDNEQTARGEAAERAGDAAAGADFWLEVWAPLGADCGIREIAHENVKVFEYPEEWELELDPPALERLEEIRAPTLVLVGDRDVLGIREIADVLAERIRDARKVVLPGADHLPNYRAPDAFNRLVGEFLSGAGG